MGVRRVIRLAVLVGTKGRGSNMQAIIEACRSGRLNAECALVIAPRESAPAVQTARSLGVEVAVMDPDDPRFAPNVLHLLKSKNVDLLCLAGYMRLLPSELVRGFADRILNIHPALLPKYGGKGMYGMRVHEAVIASGDRESGCTVHYVNEEYDSGAILLQSKCPVLPGDTPEKLAERILPLEHETYVEAIRKWMREHQDVGLKAST